MPQRLTDLIVTEASLVDFPANDEARVVLWKRDDSVGKANPNHGEHGRFAAAEGYSHTGTDREKGSLGGKAIDIHHYEDDITGNTLDLVTGANSSKAAEWHHYDAAGNETGSGKSAGSMRTHIAQQREAADRAAVGSFANPDVGGARRVHKDQPDASDVHVPTPIGAMKMVPYGDGTYTVHDRKTGKKISGPHKSKEAAEDAMTNKRLDELIDRVSKAVSNNRPHNPDGSVDPEEHREADTDPEENREANNSADLAPVGDEADEATNDNRDASVAPVHAAGEEGDSQGMLEYDEGHNVGYMEDPESGKWYLCNGEKSKIGGPFPDKVSAQAAYRSKIGKAISLEFKKGMPTDPSKYAYVPDREHPSTWKLPIHDASHASAAAAAFSSGGFRGSKVQLPPGAMAKAKAKVRAAWRKFNPDKGEDEMPDSIKKTEFDELVLTHVELGEEIAKAGKKIAGGRLQKLKDVHRVVGEMIREQDPTYQAHSMGGFVMTKKDEIFKAKSKAEDQMDDDEDEDDGADDEDEEARKRHIQKLKEKVVELKKAAAEDGGEKYFARIGKLETKLAVLKAKYEDEDEDEEDEEDEDEEEEEARKRLAAIDDPKIRKYLSRVTKKANETDERVKKAEERATAAETLAKSAEDRRVTLELTEIAKSLTGLPGNTEDKVARLRKLSTSMSKKDFDAEVTELRKSSELIKKSEVFKEIGSTTGGDAANAGDRIDQLAKARQAEVNKSAGPGQALTYHQAYNLVLQENPGLYEQYKTEMKERALHS